MRSYRQRCGVAKALDLVGERWTLLITRDLLLGGRRYTDLLAGLPGLTTNLLAKRLKDLERNGIIARRTLPPPAGSTVYELTPLGLELEPVILALGAFGARWLPQVNLQDRSDFRWLLLSLRRRYLGGAPPGQIGLLVDGVPYGIAISDQRLHTHDGWPHAPDVTLQGPAGPMVAVWAGGLPPERVGLMPQGDTSLIEALLPRLQSVLDDG